MRFAPDWFPASRCAQPSKSPRAITPEVSQTTGTIVDFQQKPTGSWFAHYKDNKLWLDRLTLKKDDGEITTLNLDQFSVVELET